MPTPAMKPYGSVDAAFKDPEAATIACCLLREAGVSAEEGDAEERPCDHRVRAIGLLPEQLERAKVILRNAGAIEIAHGERHLSGTILAGTAGATGLPGALRGAAR